MDRSLDSMLQAANVVPVWVLRNLDDWASWMRSEQYGKGYASHSIGFVSGGLVSSESSMSDMEEDAKTVASAIVDSIIDGLELPQKLAIHNHWMASVWSSQRLNLEEILIEAVKNCHKRMLSKGLG